MNVELPALVRRILVLRPSAVGDFAFALPALHALRQSYPYAEIVYGGLPWHAEFLTGRPGPVDRVEIVPPSRGIGLPADAAGDSAAVTEFVRRQRAAAYDVALQLYGGGEHSNPFVRRLGARLCVGLRAPGAPQLDRWVAHLPLQNRRLELLGAAALAGAGAPRLDRELQTTANDRLAADEVLPGRRGQPLALIQPGASDPRRRWPPASFAAVADALAAAGARVAVTGTADEAPLVASVLRHMRRPGIDLGGRLPLSGLCGMLARTALLVSNDTGPLHLALALGTPAVGIYWLGNLLESGPLRQEGHRAAVALGSHCPVCGAENLRWRCPHDDSFVAGIEAGEVTELARDLYQQALA